jgi:hypothetical protein
MPQKDLRLRKPVQDHLAYDARQAQECPSKYGGAHSLLTLPWIAHANVEPTKRMPVLGG